MTTPSRFQFQSLYQGKMLFYVVTLIGLVADLGTKVWAEGAVRPDGYDPMTSPGTPVISVIDGVLAWKWAVNFGAAFSFLSGQVLLLSVIGILALVALGFYLASARPDEKTMLVGLGLVASGAVGNIWDRINFGWVRDFIYFDFDLPGHTLTSWIPKRYPVFNVADIAILAGAVLIVIASSRQQKATTTPAPAAN
ncbi:MAG: signal peptidase II [Myxococcales bacterium]|nr:signal peptidase II [Myxococcales bacterium]